MTKCTHKRHRCECVYFCHIPCKCVITIKCSLVDIGGSHYKAFMVTPLGCKNALSPSNQVVVRINKPPKGKQQPLGSLRHHYGQYTTSHMTTLGCLDNKGAYPDKRGACLDKRGARPDKRGARLDKTGAHPDKRGSAVS